MYPVPCLVIDDAKNTQEHAYCITQLFLHFSHASNVLKVMDIKKLHQKIYKLCST